MLEKLLIAAVAGLFGFLPALLQWIADRSKSRSRSNQISKLSEELDFIERWIKLSHSVSQAEQTPQEETSTPVVQQYLDQILEEYGKLRALEVRSTREPSRVSSVRRMLLLFRPTNGKGWLIHTIFYFLIFFIAAMIVSGLEDPMINPETGENEFMYLLLGTAILFGPVLIFLQRMAMRVRKQELESASENIA